MPGLEISFNKATGVINSCMLYGKELLDTSSESKEFMVNGKPLPLRMVNDNGSEASIIMKGECFINQMTGWGLVLSRSIGERRNLKFNTYGINYMVRRDKAEPTYLIPGPTDTVLEAPLFIDTLTLFNLNWKFWGEDTRMIFSSTHSTGPTSEFGHTGYEEDIPENCKKYMQNIWRRIYPGVMAIHGGVYYNEKTEEWIAITCRRANVGYILNIEDAGEGVSYDFTLHSEFKMNEKVRLPEIKLYYGNSRKEMYEWLADYTRHFYHEPPEWMWKQTWLKDGLAWNNLETWQAMGERWIGEAKDGLYTGLRVNLVTDRPLRSGTLPKSYQPDPNYGNIEEFKAMCLELKKNNIHFLVWMSHSGLSVGEMGVEDDWFIRGIDGELYASWGSRDMGMNAINPGHPGYIEYTKKWIRFYIEECGASGIFFDCLGWTFPADFATRSFMRFPGDTNIMAIKFAEEIYSYIKSLNSEAVMIGEGCSLDMPVDMFSIQTNTRREGSSVGPRDFMLHLNSYSKKQMMIDQSPYYTPAAGLCMVKEEEEYKEHNRFITRYMKEHGGPGKFRYITDGISMNEDMLFVGDIDGKIFVGDVDGKVTVDLPNVTSLEEAVTGEVFKPKKGSEYELAFGFYKLIK